MFYSKIEKRIIEIHRILNDKHRTKEIMTGQTISFAEAQLKIANEPLLDELEELKIKRGFNHDLTQLTINLLSIITALLIAFYG